MGALDTPISKVQFRPAARGTHAINHEPPLKFMTQRALIEVLAVGIKSAQIEAHAGLCPTLSRRLS
jgi:hypothetical protein